MQVYRSVFKAGLTILFTVAMVCTAAPTALAQVKVQVMVNGPWAYVTDPTPGSFPAPRLAVVAPRSLHHLAAAVFSGPNASDFRYQPTISTGKYYLDIKNVSCNPSLPSPPPLPPAATATQIGTYPIKVPSSTIKTSVDPGNTNKNIRYAISLPFPCSYQLLIPSNSKVDTQHITAATKPYSYVTWMVLEYSVSSIADVHLIGDDDNNTTHVDTVFKFSNNGAGPGAISIALGAEDPNDTDPQCDSTSARSTKDEAMVFKQALHVEFPELRGNQQTTQYDDWCEDAIGFVAESDLEKLLLQIDNVQAYFNSPDPDKLNRAKKEWTEIKRAVNDLNPLPPEVKKEIAAIDAQLEIATAGSARASLSNSVSLGGLRYFVRSRTAAGSGDCRGAQMTVISTP